LLRVTRFRGPDLAILPARFKGQIRDACQRRSVVCPLSVSWL